MLVGVKSTREDVVQSFREEVYVEISSWMIDEDVAADEKCKTGSSTAESARRKVQGVVWQGVVCKAWCGKAWQEALTRNSSCSEIIASNLAPIHVEITASS